METYEGYREPGLKPGDRLENGAIVVFVTKVTKPPATMEHGLLLAVLPANKVTPWVSWYFNTNRENPDREPVTTYWGDYYYNTRQAAEGWLARLEKSGLPESDTRNGAVESVLRTLDIPEEDPTYVNSDRPEV
jgi:hypothetical protein